MPLKVIMIKRCHVKTFTIITFLLLCIFLSSMQVQSKALAGEGGTGLFLDDSTKKEASDKIKGYTKIISTLLVVIALIIAAVFVVKKNYGLKGSIGRGKRHIQILEHSTLGVKKSIFLVKVPGKHLLIGVTNDKIGLITEIANEDVEDTNEGTNKSEFVNLIKKSYLEKKQR